MINHQRRYVSAFGPERFPATPKSIGLSCHARRLAASAVMLVLSAGILSGCTWPQEVRGNLPDTQAVTEVQIGQSTKADVTRLLGSPSSISTFDPNIWYYISRRLQRETLADAKLLEQRVYVVTFDSQGVVKDFQTHLNDEQDVAMISRTTPAPGKELSFVEQLLGNFGKFTGADAKKPAS